MDELNIPVPFVSKELGYRTIMPWREYYRSVNLNLSWLDQEGGPSISVTVPKPGYITIDYGMDRISYLPMSEIAKLIDDLTEKIGIPNGPKT